MKKDGLSFSRILVSIILSSLLTLILNKVSDILNPTFNIGNWFIVILLVLVVVFSGIANVFSEEEERLSNRLAALKRQYGSLWLIVLLASIISLVGNELHWIDIDFRVILLLIFIVAVMGYKNDLNSRRKYGATAKIPLYTGPIPHPFDYDKSKESKDKKA